MARNNPQIRQVIQEAPSTLIKVESLWSLGVKKFYKDKVGLSSLFVVLFYLLLALGAGLGLWAAEWDELLNDNGYGPISWDYWLGTNFNGQDIFQRAVYSTLTAFKVGLVVALASLFIGICLGCIAGFYSHTWVDEVIIWLYGCLDCIPFYLFVAAVSFALRESDASMYVAMIGVLWTSSCKVLRAQVIKLKNLQFVEAARAIGVKDPKIIIRHIIPNLTPLILIELSLAFVTAIKTEAILSFLGIGVKEGISWGVMLAEASAEVVAGRYHNFFAASIFMFGLVMAFNQLSDALQDAFDPKKVSVGW